MSPYGRCRRNAQRSFKDGGAFRAAKSCRGTGCDARSQLMLSKHSGSQCCNHMPSDAYNPFHPNATTAPLQAGLKSFISTPPFQKASPMRAAVALLLGLAALASYAAVGCAFLLPCGHTALGPYSAVYKPMRRLRDQHAAPSARQSTNPYPTTLAHKRERPAAAAPQPPLPAPPPDAAARASVPVAGLDDAARGRRYGAGAGGHGGARRPPPRRRYPSFRCVCMVEGLFASMMSRPCSRCSSEGM